MNRAKAMSSINSIHVLVLRTENSVWIQSWGREEEEESLVLALSLISNDIQVEARQWSGACKQLRLGPARPCWHWRTASTGHCHHSRLSWSSSSSPGTHSTSPGRVGWSQTSTRPTWARWGLGRGPKWVTISCRLNKFEVNFQSEWWYGVCLHLVNPLSDITLHCVCLSDETKTNNWCDDVLGFCVENGASK